MSPARLLRPGRGPFSRDQVEEIQRARVLSGMVEVAAEHGFLGAAVGRVVERSGVSRRTFYELFESREDCFLAAFEWGIEQATEPMVRAYRAETQWREQIRAALAALLGFLDAEPGLARVCVVEAMGAGAIVLERRALVLKALAQALQAGVPRGGAAHGPPLLSAESVVGGAFSAVHARMLEGGRGGGRGGMTALLGQLMALVMLPYLGPRVAGEELTRAPPELPTPAPGAGLQSRRQGGRLFERPNTRITYRTVRCLLFIAEHPGASNREIAIGAGSLDEGQTSKLLTRLGGLELIANRAGGPGRPNAWTITRSGEGVLSVVATAPAAR